MRLTFLTLWAALLGLAAPTSADVIYTVGPSSTYATFQAALAQASTVAGGAPFAVTVRVQAETANYAALDLNPIAYDLHPQPGAGLVLEGLPGASPVFVGSGSAALRVSGIANVSLIGLGTQGSPSDSLHVESASNFVADGLNLQGGGVSAITAIHCPSLTVRNTVLSPSSGTGLFMDDCSNAVARSNSLPSSSTPSYGFVAQNSVRVWLDQNNSGGADRGFNVFSSAYVSLTANVAIKRGGSRGVALDNAPFTWALKNLLIGQSVGFEALASTSCALVQNTVWDHSTAGLYARSNCAPLTLKNNLWQGFLAFFLDSATEASLTSDNQGFSWTGQFGLGASSYPGLSDWQVTLHDQNSLASDPVFANAGGTQPTDFKLTAASPMLGYGTNLSASYTTDFFLDPLPAFPTAWDPGFHVLSAPQATPSPTPVLPTPTASPTASPTPSASPTQTPVATAIGSATSTATPAPTSTITPTSSVTPYPIQKDRVITYPNPFRPNVGKQNIVFDTAEDASVKIFDQNSQLVAELLSSSIQAGLGHALWDGRDRNGSLVPPGLYFCIVRSTRSTHFTRFTVLY